MKFKIKKELLVEVLNEIKKCVQSGRNTNVIEVESSVYFNIQKDQIEVKATDLTMFAENIIEPEEVEKEGEIVVPFDVLYKLIKKYPSEIISFHINDNTMHLIHKDNDYKIPLVDGEFPQPYKVESDVDIQIQEDLLKDIFKRFSKIIPDDAHKNAFTGMNINIKSDNTIDFVATDAYRLYIFNYKPKNISGLKEMSYIVPKDLIKYLESVLENENNHISLSFNTDYVQFKKESLTVKHQLITGTYPDYEKIIPDDLPKKIKIDTKKFKETINRIKILSEFAIGDDVIYLKTNDKGCLSVLTSDEENIENTEIKISNKIDTILDYNQVLDFINKTKDEVVNLQFTDDKKQPLVFNDDLVSYMLLPIRTR